MEINTEEGLSRVKHVMLTVYRIIVFLCYTYGILAVLGGAIALIVFAVNHELTTTHVVGSIGYIVLGVIVLIVTKVVTWVIHGFVAKKNPGTAVQQR